MAGMTSFKIVYGHDPPSIVPFVRGKTQFPNLEEFLSVRDGLLAVLK